MASSKFLMAERRDYGQPEPARDPNPVHHALALIERMDLSDLETVASALLDRMIDLHDQAEEEKTKPSYDNLLLMLDDVSAVAQNLYLVAPPAAKEKAREDKIRGARTVCDQLLRTKQPKRRR